MEFGAFAGESLPIFRLDGPSIRGDDHLSSFVGMAGFDLTGKSADFSPGVIRFSGEGFYADVDVLTGSVWIARNELWAIPLGPAASAEADVAPGVLLTGAFTDLVGMAARLPLSPPLVAGATLTLGPGWSANTVAARWTRHSTPGKPKGTRETLPVHRTKTAVLRLSAPLFGLSGIPLRGRGCQLSSRLDLHETSFLGLNLGIPKFSDAPPVSLRALDRRAVEERLRQTYPSADALIFDGHLQFRVVTVSDALWLVPHWLLDVRGVINGRDMRLRSVLVPAVTLSPDAPTSGNPFTAVAGGVHVAQPSCHVSLQGWSGGGLGYSVRTVDAASAALTGANWTIDRYEDAAARASRWSATPAVVNDSDLAIFVGHGTASGIDLIGGGKSHMLLASCRFGGHLKWVLTDACGVLQDKLSGSYTCAFERHEMVFDGLRALIGYATPQEQNSLQLPQAIAHALKGDGLVQAWFQACCQHQGARTNSNQNAWVGAMMACDANGLPSIADTLQAPEHVGVMPGQPDQLLGIWTPVA